MFSDNKISLYELKNPVTLDPCGHLLEGNQIQSLQQLGSKCPSCQIVFTKVIYLQFGNEIKERKDYKKKIKALKLENDQVSSKCTRLADIWFQINNIDKDLATKVNELFQDTSLRMQHSEIHSEALSNVFHRIWDVFAPGYRGYLTIDKMRTLSMRTLTKGQITQLENEINDLENKKALLLIERNKLLNS